MKYAQYVHKSNSLSSSCAWQFVLLPLGGNKLSLFAELIMHHIISSLIEKWERESIYVRIIIIVDGVQMMGVMAIASQVEWDDNDDCTLTNYFKYWFVNLTYCNFRE